MRHILTDIGAIKHAPPPKSLRLAQGDFGILVAWWFVIACCITAFDLVSSRAHYVPLYASVVDHLWQVILCTGLIGAISAERRKLLWCLISALGGLAALALMVIAITLVSGLLAV